MALLPILRRLGPSPLTPPPSSTSSTPARSIDSTITSPVPNAQILAHLLAYIFNDDYTILSLLRSHPSQGESVDETLDVEQKLGGLVVRWGGALPLLWTYLWGMDEPSVKGKGKAAPRQVEACWCGCFERDNPERARIIDFVFRVILSAAQASTANLFLINMCLPEVQDFLMNRLYGLEVKRKYEVTFPPRSDWHVADGDEADSEALGWTEPSPVLRAVYLALFRRMLEAAVTQRLTWRLFSIVKAPLTAKKRERSASSHGEVTAKDDETGPSQQASLSPKDLDETPRPPRKRQKPPHLTLPSETVSTGFEVDTLNYEVLDLLRHAMKARWPAVFVFRGGKKGDEGGLELADMGRPWATPQKGFTFSVSTWSVARWQVQI